MKKIILVGGGGHALSVLEMIEDHDIFAGYVDLLPNAEMPIPYLGNDEEVINKYSPLEYEVHHAIVYAKDVNLRLRQYMIQRYAEYKVATLRASSSVITNKSTIGDGSGIFLGAVLNKSTIGNNCIINTRAVLEHNSIIGNNVFVGPNATVCGNAKIGDNVLIGAGVVIRDDISICNDVVIGMGSVVVKDIMKPGLYVGIPAKFIKEL